MIKQTVSIYLSRCLRGFDLKITVKPPTYDLFGTVKKRSVNGGGLYWEVGLFLARPKACSELIQDNTQKLKREYVMPNIITCHWIKIQCIKKEMKFVIKKIETMIMMIMMIKLKSQSHIYTEIEPLP